MTIMPPKNKNAGRGKKNMGQENEQYDGGDDEYRKRRERNNEAVKKSRFKSKLRTQATLERVQKLKTENQMLEEKIKLLSKELEFLKELFFAHTGTSKINNIDPSQYEILLKATASDTSATTTTRSRPPRKTSIEERKEYRG